MNAFTPLNDPGFVRAFAHPLRAQILGILEERRASPKELAAELGLPLANVAYHVRILSDLKLIRLVKKTPRRGAIEHHYEAVGHARVSDAAWGAAPSVVKDRLVAGALGEVARSVNEAAAAGGFDRTTMHLTRTRLVLDEAAWAELGDMMKGVLRRAEELQLESADRLKKADHEGELRSQLVMMLFESGVGVPESAGQEKPAAKRRSSSKSRAATR